MDWTKIEQLLGIVDKAKDHPKLVHLTNAALAELDQHAAVAKKDLDEAAAEKAKVDHAEATKRIEAVAKAKAEAEDAEATKGEPEAAPQPTRRRILGDANE
jgi:ADP-ribose pyrophosphatase YjhB (NUDIX family)